MNTPRRRVLRPVPAIPRDESRRLRRLERQHAQLDTHRQTLARWMSKLKRAFHTIERLQAQISRLEKQLARPS